jgi:hypothetical protein
MIQFSTCNQARNLMVILVLKMILLMKMIATILKRRRNQVYFVIFINYSSHKNYYHHIAVEKDFPLDLKIKRENNRTEDDIRVVGSDIKLRDHSPLFRIMAEAGFFLSFQS